MSERTIRCFAAIAFGDTVTDRVAACVDRLRADVGGVRWVKRAQLHVTLKFFGEIESGRLEALRAALGEAAEGQRPLELRLGAPGSFPPRGVPRVVWLGLHDEGRRLHTLAERVEVAAERQGFARERRPFRAHLTLGRVKRGARPRGLEEALKPLAHEELGQDRIDELRLYQSELRPDGARYTVLDRWPLIEGSEER